MYLLSYPPTHPPTHRVHCLPPCPQIYLLSYAIMLGASSVFMSSFGCERCRRPLWMLLPLVVVLLRLPLPLPWLLLQGGPPLEQQLSLPYVVHWFPHCLVQTRPT